MMLGFYNLKRYAGCGDEGAKSAEVYKIFWEWSFTGNGGRGPRGNKS